MNQRLRMGCTVLAAVLLMTMAGCAGDTADYCGVSVGMEIAQVYDILPAEDMLHQGYYIFYHNSDGNPVVACFGVDYTVLELHCYAKNTVHATEKVFDTIKEEMTVLEVVSKVGNPAAKVEGETDTLRFEANNGAVYHIQFGIGIGEETNYEVVSVTKEREGSNSGGSVLWIVIGAAALAAVVIVIIIANKTQKKAKKRKTQKKGKNAKNRWKITNQPAPF
ncbi:MAG: hypothetical protein J6L24_02660 [Oscillospiraceae bacterium]|nr:hypothetical protein [Oscillospiraceae bacterium]